MKEERENQYLYEQFMKLGKSQKEVTEDLNVHQPYASELMNGKRAVGREMAKRIEEAYGFDFASMLSGVDETKLIKSVIHISENKEDEREKLELDNLKDKLLNSYEMQIDVMRKQIKLLEDKLKALGG